MEIRKANVSMLDSDEIEITLDLSQSKRFRNEENFDYEHIDADLFIKSLDNAPLILNHRKEKIVSELEIDKKTYKIYGEYMPLKDEFIEHIIQNNN